MGLIDIIKPLSMDLRCAVNKSQQYQEKNSWECRESNPGLLGEKQVCYLCAMHPPKSRAQHLQVLRQVRQLQAQLGHLHQRLHLRRQEKMIEMFLMPFCSFDKNLK